MIKFRDNLVVAFLRQIFPIPLFDKSGQMYEKLSFLAPRSTFFVCPAEHPSCKFRILILSDKKSPIDSSLIDDYLE